LAVHICNFVLLADSARSAFASWAGWKWFCGKVIADKHYLLDCAHRLITNRIKKRQWLLFVFLTTGLILSLVGLAVWRGEQQVNPGYFQSMYILSMVGSVVFTALLVIGILYMSGWTRR
jgi:hypothetical protein